MNEAFGIQFSLRGRHDIQSKYLSYTVCLIYVVCNYVGLLKLVVANKQSGNRFTKPCILWTTIIYRYDTKIAAM